MKKITGILTASLAVVILISSCNDASKKDMSDASKNLKEANNDVKEAVIATNDTAKANAISNWNAFKNESEGTIAGMEKQITSLEGKITKANNKEKEKLKANLEKKKEKLQQRNTEFENDKDKFDAAVVSKNQSFEREFKHDMNELGTALKDLFKDNVK